MADNQMRSFANEVSGSPQALPTGNATPQSANLTGGMTDGGLVTVPSRRRNLDTILEIGKVALAPYAQQLQQEAYIQGMQRVAQGEAIETIIKDQPWYTRIFGPNGQIEGARAYSAQTSRIQFEVGVERDMNELRSMDTTRFSQEMARRMTEASTGDDIADVQAKAMMFESMPGLIQRHTKEAYKYSQERAKEMRQQAWGVTGVSLQYGLMADEGMLTPEQIQARKDAYVSLLRPTPGADLGSWSSDLALHIQTQIDAGNFHALNALRESGVLANVPTEARLRMDAGIDAASKVHAAGAMENYAQEWAQLRNDARNGLINAADVHKWSQIMNHDYSRRSGNHRQLFPMMENLGVYDSAIQAQRDILTANAREFSREQNETIKRSEVRGGLAINQWRLGDVLASGYDSKMAEQAWLDEWTSKDMDGQLAMMNETASTGANGIPTMMKNNLASMVNTARAGTITDSWSNGFQIWRGLGEAGGVRTRDMWFSADDVAFFNVFDKVLGDRDIGQFGEAAFRVTNDSILTRSATVNRDLDKTLQRYMDDQTSRGGIPLLGYFATRLEPRSSTVLLNNMRRHAQVLQGSTDPDRLAEQAFSLSMSDMEVIGQHGWNHTPDARRFSDYLVGTDPEGNMFTYAPERVGPIFDDVISDHVKSVIPRNNGFTVYRGSDEREGVARLHIQVYTNDGYEFLSVNSQEVLAGIDAWYKRQILTGGKNTRYGNIPNPRLRPLPQPTEE